MRRVFLAVVLILAPLAAGSSSAQTVEGRILDAAGAPVDVALVILLSEAGEAVRSVLSRADGSYSIQAGRPGRFRLRVERLGINPHSTQLFELAANQVLRLPVTITFVPLRLEEIRADANRRCPVRPQDGTAIASSWESAKRTLQLLGTLDPVEELGGMRAIHYVRELDRGGSRQTAVQAVREFDASSRIPFGTLPERSYTRAGFALTGTDGVSGYFGPPPAALLSDAFLETHCFNRITESGGRIGLSFQPAEKLTWVGVGGTIWLERGSLEVRVIDYQYRDPATGEPNGASGRIEIGRLPNGAPIVTQWWIRLPSRIEIADQRDPGKATVLALSEEGGMLLDATGVPHAAEASQILATLRRVPPAGASVPNPLQADGASMVIRAVPNVTYSVAERVLQITSNALTELEIERLYPSAQSMGDLLIRKFPSLALNNGRISVRSLCSSEPHYRINGVPASSAWALGLHPRDVTNIRLLRGGETAFYGFQGSCGVIEITTK